jgi:hypothetical protein
LDEISSHRFNRQKVSEISVDEQLLREKAKSSRDVQGIMIAVVVLLLTLIVIVEQSRNSLTEYQHAMHSIIFGVALVTILSWILSMDIFDTVLNSFQVKELEAFNLRRYFYRKIGPLKADGAIGFSGQCPRSGVLRALRTAGSSRLNRGHVLVLGCVGTGGVLA